MNKLSFSEKQQRVMSWWCREESDYEGIICDGAVRSGKSFCMSFSFLLWAFSSFEGKNFGICGKTIRSVRRNLMLPLKQQAEKMGFLWKEHSGENAVEISYRNQKNRFYLFGGQHEGSAALIQGITLAGVLLDEVALMPRSFVEQAVARCSEHGSKLWFNCNPEHPYHWFYRDWILKAREKKLLYLHFLMEDNPSLEEKVKKRYERLFSGAFYDRYVLGKWTATQGLVYPEFQEQRHVYREDGGRKYERYFVSCDYGTVNPTSMGLWGSFAGKWYRLREYYYDSKRDGGLKTDEEYYLALERMLGQIIPEAVILDPSAVSFMETIRRHGKYRVIPAQNNVAEGIQRVRELLKDEKLLFHESCTDTIREFYQYVWEENTSKDIPKKEHDHAMDEIRYFVNTVYTRLDGFFAISVAREG